MPSNEDVSARAAAGSLRGRGAPSNPAGRYERLAFEADLDALRDEAEVHEATPLHTQYLRDTSRNVVATNDSPDIGFDASVNPYRGCEHGCAYCLDGETRILMATGTTKALADLVVGDAVYGTVGQGTCRRLVATRVLHHWTTHKPAWRVALADGTELVASGDHRFLTERGWAHVARAPGRSCAVLRAGGRDRIVGAAALTPSSASRGTGGRTTAVAADLRVIAVVPLGERRRLHDITTGTGDFIANGVVSHNCYARPTHEYLGFSAGLDFESRILVKEDAPALLEKKLRSRSWKPQVIAMSGVTDPYQPVERRLRLTRGCLEVLARFRNPVAVITKNHLVTRDSDLLAELARHGAAAASLSVTTLDPDLARRMEPRTSSPAMRLDAIRKLSDAGVPAGVMVAPVIPGLTDHEIPAILAAAAEAGATRAGLVVLRLPHGVKDLFSEWLETHRPDRKEKVLNRVRALRGGALYDATWRRRQRGEGLFADQIARLFETGRRRAGIPDTSPPLSAAAFRVPPPHGQGLLFDG